MRNGIPYSESDTVTRFIEAPLAVEGEALDYEESDNVLRVKRVFTEEQFKHVFPLRDLSYTYDGFLQAVGKYPYFCDDKGPHLSDYTLDEACKRELSVMFAHFN